MTILWFLVGCGRSSLPKQIHFLNIHLREAQRWIMVCHIHIWVCANIPLSSFLITVFFFMVCFCVLSRWPVVRMGLCTLMHQKVIITEGTFDMLFVQIRTETHHIFSKVSHDTRGFMHTNAPQVSRFAWKRDCSFMMRYAQKRTRWRRKHLVICSMCFGTWLVNMAHICSLHGSSIANWMDLIRMFPQSRSMNTRAAVWYAQKSIRKCRSMH